MTSQTLQGEVFGHAVARETLRHLRAHTLLFLGPPRVGRRQVARWYARYLNCANPGAEPCGRCESCRLFAADEHPDYREIAPVSDTKTGRRSRRPQLRIGDLVRREDGAENPLGPWLEARPRFAKRVGVIDGAEALSEAAANAFLKFLEEPPSYAVIILIAASLENVLPTIVSRSAPVRFGAVEAAIDLPQEHPAAKLGRVGDLLTAAAHPEAFSAQLEVVHSYLLALEKGLEEALEKADALEKAWSEPSPFSVPELLRARLSLWPPAAYAEALIALERSEEALAAYAAPGIAVQVLTLELRDMYRRYAVSSL
jgi:DNA polymerase-3 subunit delta'